MAIYFLLIATLLIGGLCFFILYKFVKGPIRNNWPFLFLVISLSTFIYLYGTWVFLSVYIKYLFVISVIITLVYNILYKQATVNRKLSPGKQAIFTLTGVLFTTLSILYFTGTIRKPYSKINLALPFRNGTYFVFQGGKGLPTNLFHYNIRGTILAMDIVKLNKWGNRANNVFSKDLTDYEIFNDTLFSPCDGIITKTQNNNPDNIPPNHKRGPTNTNQVLIDGGDFYVFMAHLKFGCVFVHEGQKVVTGQPVGLAGNSGFSLEPHLHIQAQVNTHKNIPWYKENPMQIEFNGKFYGLFDEIKAE